MAPTTERKCTKRQCIDSADFYEEEHRIIDKLEQRVGELTRLAGSDPVAWAGRLNAAEVKLAGTEAAAARAAKEAAAKLKEASAKLAGTEAAAAKAAEEAAVKLAGAEAALQEAVVRAEAEKQAALQKVEALRVEKEHLTAKVALLALLVESKQREMDISKQRQVHATDLAKKEAQKREVQVEALQVEQVQRARQIVEQARELDSERLACTVQAEKVMRLEEDLRWQTNAIGQVRMRQEEISGKLLEAISQRERELEAITESSLVLNATRKELQVL